MKKALYRKRICAEKEKLTPEKVFHTPQYRDLLTSIGHEITGGKLTTLRLYDDKNSGIAGWNQGETVAVNLGNQITASFLTLELKSDSLIGILGHECGHYRYTDSALRKRYAEHMLNGSWYPKEPVPENAQEKEALDAMNVHFERKDKAILSIFLQTASYLSNLLNDMYIEEKMCALFPGSIRRGILMNRDRNVEWLPTLREMLETEKDRLSILMNLCAQYALSSTVYLHCCADFETDEKDRFRIAGMQPYGSNRDGTALWYAGSRLLERPEKQKLLFVISDGAPNANQYGGIGAKRDLQKIRKKLLQQGVFFQAAAIGSDKEAIQEIYEESFLDITDLEQLPALLTKKLLRFIRR